MIRIQNIHEKKIELLLAQMRNLLEQRRSQNNPPCISLQYHSSKSFTTRTKSYKQKCYSLDCESLNDVIQIDPHKQIAIVEPRVTMEELIHATLPYKLTVPVIPEFKGITVGGAIMGMAGESGSHRWGCFNDACTAFEILLGDGSLLRATPYENPDVFYGIAGSYGSLGLIVSAEIQLIPIKDFVHLRYTIFSNPIEAAQTLKRLSSVAGSPDFLDGIVFAKDLAVVIEGNFQSKENISKKLPTFSLDPVYSQYYYQHVKEIVLKSGSNSYEELMTHEDYFFRYDRCAFWMGTYLFHLPFLTRFIGEGILKVSKSNQEWFNEAEIQKFQISKSHNIFFRTLLYPFMTSKFLGKLLHQARTEKLIKNRFIIQDFCIPEINASQFLSEVIQDPAVFPMWLLPIKGTNHPQIFAPHLLTNEKQENLFINIGIYGLPSYSAPIEQITRTLEQKTKMYGGRKVLYSHSYYTQDEFWSIYSHGEYMALREKTCAKGVFQEITEKVLSV